MSLQKMRRAGRQLKLALAPSCYFASLVLIALFFLPADSFAKCTTTTTNPNLNPNPESFVAVGDFNGDCKSDILWRNGATEEVYGWLMNGTSTLSAQSLGSPTSDWVIQGVGDFNGDGMADILWRSSSTGQVYIWFMNGTTVTSSQSLGSPTSDWVIQGVGDFNDDGMADIVWRNTTTGQVYIWFMNGATVTSSQTPGSPTLDWNIEGVGDFNGDGFADLLWRNGTTGQVYIWLMNGATVTSSVSPGGPTSVWAIEGLGDFDGNGTSDILWQNSSTGQVYIWFMSGTTITSSQSPASPAPPQSTACCNGVGNGWSIQGVGDYDGSGRAGILWRQLGSGQTYVWLMNGNTITTSQSPTNPAPVWDVVTLAPYGCLGQVLCNLLYGTDNARANGPFEGPSPDPQNPPPSSEPGGPLNAVVWDPGAAAVAQGWAAQCQGLTHNTNRDGGENIYIEGSTTTPVTITGTDAVNDWMSEVDGYTYPTGSGDCNPSDTSEGCGHYSQEVWRTTTAMGCAVQQCTQNSPFGMSFPDYALVVCDYTPAANWPVAPY